MPRNELSLTHLPQWRNPLQSHRFKNQREAHRNAFANLKTQTPASDNLLEYRRPLTVSWIAWSNKTHTLSHLKPLTTLNDTRLESHIPCWSCRQNSTRIQITCSGNKQSSNLMQQHSKKRIEGSQRPHKEWTVSTCTQEGGNMCLV